MDSGLSADRRRPREHRPDRPLDGRALDARTTERTDKKGDKVVLTSTRVVSEDGKTMTVTTKGTNAQGQALDNVTIWEKQ